MTPDESWKENRKKRKRTEEWDQKKKSLNNRVKIYIKR
jgi:hypothetical protein